ncbi:hypothetical protein CR513_26549, partial [Mucuna pruriens]
MTAKKYVLFVRINGKNYSTCGVMLMTTPLHDDNTSVIHIATNLVYQDRTKYIEAGCHSIHEVYDQRVISLPTT